MYREGSVRLYESVRWSATSYRGRSFSGLLRRGGRGRVEADSVPKLLYPEEDIPQRRMMCK